MLRQRRIQKNAQTNAARLKAADEARSDGDIQLACRIYLRVATDRSFDSSVQAARRRLGELKAEAGAQHEELLGRLASWLEAPEHLAEDGGRGLAECMMDFSEMAERYGDVPEVGRKIKSTMSTHLKKPTVRAVVYEPKANHLWKTGRELEVQGNICCALLVYRDAATQVPAPSALLAQERIKQLELDPQNIKDAEDCHALKWCHQKYRIAELLAKSKPQRARDLFHQIAQRAPTDSKIHQEARAQVAKLQ